MGDRRFAVPFHADRDASILFAFDRSTVQSWPIQNYTTHWFSVAWDDPAVRSALWLSVKAGAAATFLALVLGSLAAFGVHRYRFFGREAISLFIVLPIALPGIITGLALRSFFTFAGINLSLMTIVIGHTTFCIVVIYNNVISVASGAPRAHWARLQWTLVQMACRRSAMSLCRPSRPRARVWWALSLCSFL